MLKGLLAYQESIHFMQTINLDFPGEDGYMAVFSTLDEQVARGEGGRERSALVESEDLAALVPKSPTQVFAKGLNSSSSSPASDEDEEVRFFTEFVNMAHPQQQAGHPHPHDSRSSEEYFKFEGVRRKCDAEWKAFAAEKVRDTQTPHKNTTVHVPVWMDVLPFRKLGLLPGPPMQTPIASSNCMTADLLAYNTALGQQQQTQEQPSKQEKVDVEMYQQQDQSSMPKVQTSSSSGDLSNSKLNLSNVPT